MNVKQRDVVIVGAGFGGFACALALAKQGLKVTVLERKKDISQEIHTTGIIVDEAKEELSLPEELIKSISRVKLYSPSLHSFDIHSKDYFFYTTDTPGLMKHMADQACEAGVELLLGSPFQQAIQRKEGIFLEDYSLSCRFLVGADGPRSSVARHFKLGQNQRFLMGLEAEFSLEKYDFDDQAFHCFADNKLAKGYLGWVIPGVKSWQVGLASCYRNETSLNRFLQKIEPYFPFSQTDIIEKRGGLIPVNGVVRPFFNNRVILLGDAAGLVSPLTAGGIHTALRYGRKLGELLANHLEKKAPHPSVQLEKSYPRFHFKRFLRFFYENCCPNWLLNLVMRSYPFRQVARIIFFKRKRLR